jgi:hypothetical protein
MPPFNEIARCPARRTLELKCKCSTGRVGQLESLFLFSVLSALLLYYSPSALLSSTHPPCSWAPSNDAMRTTTTVRLLLANDYVYIVQASTSRDL